jgi:hypothetical protein
VHEGHFLLQAPGRYIPAVHYVLSCYFSLYYLLLSGLLPHVYGGSLSFVSVDHIGGWLNLSFGIKLGPYDSTGNFLNYILDKELVSLTIHESRACSRCSYKCTVRLHLFNLILIHLCRCFVLQ